MRVSLSVTLEKGENNEQLISAHFDVDDNITNLEKETYHMLLSAVTTQMLMMKASETQAMLVESLKSALQAIDNGIVLVASTLDDKSIKRNMENLQTILATKAPVEERDSQTEPEN